MPSVRPGLVCGALDLMLPKLLIDPDIEHLVECRASSCVHYNVKPHCRTWVRS